MASLKESGRCRSCQASPDIEKSVSELRRQGYLQQWRDFSWAFPSTLWWNSAVMLKIRYAVDHGEERVKTVDDGWKRKKKEKHSETLKHIWFCALCICAWWETSVGIPKQGGPWRVQLPLIEKSTFSYCLFQISPRKCGGVWLLRARESVL